MDYSGMIKITDKARNEILHISSTSPREIGLKFSTWSLRSIAGYVKEKKMIKDGKPYCYTRYFNRTRCRMETFTDCSW
jgi:hypothetical protein